MLNIFQQKNTPADGSNSKPVVPAPTAKADYRKYVDATGEFDSKELQYGLWYVKNRVAIYRTIVGALMVICVLLGIYSFGAWSLYLADTSSYNLMLARLTQAQNYAAINERLLPKPLQVLSTDVLAGGVGKYDIVTQVVNPNPKFVATIDYYFVLNGASTTKRTTTLLPGDQRPVAELGLSISPGSSAAFVVAATRWHRLSAHTYLNPSELQADRLNFTISSSTYISANNNPNGVRTNVITFNLTNNGAYSYVQPSFYVGLYLRDALVGLMPLTLPQLSSLETVPVDLRNFVQNLQVTDVKIFPLINVYDSSVYLAPSV